MTVIVALPLPPSINAAFRNPTARDGKQHGRIKTRLYTEWIADATAKLILQKPGKISGDVRVEYLLGPRSRQSDLGNREKCLTDLLVRCGIIEDDRFIVELTLRWDNTIRGACATVRAA